MNTDFCWNVNSDYPEEPQPYGWPFYHNDWDGPLDFQNAVTHELGHGINLTHCDNSLYTYTMLWYIRNRYEFDKRTLKTGDQAGAVHNVTKPDGALTFDQCWSAYQKTTSYPYLPDSVRVYGNVTISTGYTLNVDSGVYVKLNGYYVKSTGGTFADSNAEWDPYIAVKNGSSLKGMYPTFKSAVDNSSSGDTIIIGNDVTLPSGQSTTLNSNTTVKFKEGKKLEIYGSLTVGSGVVFTKDTGVTNWSGIDLKSGGTMTVNGDITIEYADVGIDFLGGTLSNSGNTVTIQYCQNAGVYAYNVSPTISNVKCQNISYNAGLLAGGASANPTFSYDTVENSVRGLYVVGANASMDYCDIKDTNNYDSIIFSGGGLADLDGYNNIDPKDNYYAISNQNAGSIPAQHNYWGVANPPSSLFQYPNLVDYTNYSSTTVPGTGVYKTIGDIEKPPRKIALELERNGDFTGAYSIYSDLFAKETEPEWRKLYITSMLRVCDKSTKNYNDLRSKITQELPAAKGIYKGSLDFILCDILFREGKYNEAVNAFTEKVADYQNDQTTVEMYTRISEIYSNYLNDKTSGLRYADMAKAINPGSPALRLAYEFAGSSYDPSKFTDVFGAGAQKQEPETETVATSDYIETYPNPANPATTISYSLSSPSKVNLTVYNITGQKVATLIDGRISAGIHSVKFDGSRYASGLYFYRFSSDKFTKTGKMMILK